MDYSRFLNDISANRKPSPLRVLIKMIKTSPKRIVNFAVGMPNTGTYPFQSISVNLKDGTTLNIDGNLLTTALEYGPSDGYPKLVATLREFQKRLHNPPLSQDEWSIAVTAGSQDGICKAFEMLFRNEDYIISDEYLYPGTISIVRPYNVKHLKVSGDKYGMRPDSLREVLSPWDPEDIKKRTTGIPKVLYIVPNGGNPLGTSTSAQRRQEIYEIAQQYNLLIIEDDPYYFMQFDLEQKSPSFLSMDVDGRVLRYDSFSKMISGGLRVGFMTGPQTLVKQIELHIQASQLQVSGLTQVIVHELLTHWSFDGFIKHTEKIALFYKSQRDVMIKCAVKWLTGLAEWNTPECGMFLWIHILGLKDTRNLINNRCLPKQICFLPGFHCTLDNSPTPYVRASFSYTTEEETDQGMRILAEAIREELISQN